MRRAVLLIVRGLLLLALAVPLPGMAALDSHHGKGAEQSPAPMSVDNRANRPTRVMIELADEPAAPLFARARDAAMALGGSHRAHAVAQATVAARAQLARIDAAQQELLPELARLNATTLFRTQRVYNGMAVQASADALLQIARMPGVVAIHPLPSVRLTNASSVPFIGAPQVWGGTAAATGKNIKIGIIDTGIDYIHTDFGGSGRTDDYVRNDTTIITDTPALFPSAKVAGGYDFVGDAYDSISSAPAQNVPHPDPDPMDCQGHGSHVAGTAAGMGVNNSDGATYAGPYNNALDFSTFRVGPGVAPEATLYALRIFGCGGSASSDVVSEAIEWAVDPNKDGDFSDRLDVINMSLGASAGGSLDTQSVASDNAAKLGVVVVASTGNDGDNYTIASSPGNAPRVLSVAATGETTPDTLASFSSRGPGSSLLSLKPDIAAPGLSIFSAANRSGNQGRFLSGTSMASPHVAGTLALLRQIHPDWTVEELKALAMNTALHDVSVAAGAASTAYGPGRVGAGRVDVARAAAQQVIAYNADGSGTVSVSFGALEVTEPITIVKQVVVANKGTRMANYQLACQQAVTIPGVSYSVEPADVVLLPSHSAQVTITLRADPAAMQHTHDPSVPETQDGAPRHWLSEAAGYLTMTDSATSALVGRLPVYAVARPASRMQAVERALPDVDQGRVTGTLSLSGTGLTSTMLPTRELSIMTAYELAYTSPENTPTDVGRNADLQYVGIASNVSATSTKSVSDATLFFGLATYRDWASPHQVEFEILIDSNRDGKDDYSVLEWNLRSATGSGVSDVFVTAVHDLATGKTNERTLFLNGLPARPTGGQPLGLDSVLFNTNVMMLPIMASDIGLSDTHSSFNYHVRTWSTDRGDTEFLNDVELYGAPVDETPVLTYNAAQPGLDVANRSMFNMPLYADVPSTTVTYLYDAAAFGRNHSRGLLLFHHHNISGQRAEVVAPGGQAAAIQLALPLIAK
ncbi:MAG TPA: S8 family serine peptidase [Roseiflexaceae bacterium]|nr:S8 family serine peptidase [Roseiflexaceae bacterium]